MQPEDQGRQARAKPGETVHESTGQGAEDEQHGLGLHRGPLQDLLGDRSSSVAGFPQATPLMAFHASVATAPRYLLSPVTMNDIQIRAC